ncbi:type II toxin-antitoxin system Y4mF family antitoxin [Seleniivibrio woodruffii]|jgi:y4mF family transcriptional regulator|uniref:type II toxin-antitoxin system Y4mF family antitoxin n=1 Tax=Seleniivibrio woodruffii TaxID=1078050 RepID=UPI0026EBA5B8|nr:type II toxin-antitoxin system Y4mF family antitoxin [Seleniivibrio woodruffii]
MQILNSKDFGTIIRKKRKELGLTQTQLAQLSGVGLRFISELERGKESARIGYAIKIASNLGIDISAESRG